MTPWLGGAALRAGLCGLAGLLATGAAGPSYRAAPTAYGAEATAPVPAAHASPSVRPPSGAPRAPRDGAGPSDGPGGSGPPAPSASRDGDAAGRSPGASASPSPSGAGRSASARPAGPSRSAGPSRPAGPSRRASRPAGRPERPRARDRSGEVRQRPGGPGESYAREHGAGDGTGASGRDPGGAEEHGGAVGPDTSTGPPEAGRDASEVPVRPVPRSLPRAEEGPGRTGPRVLPLGSGLVLLGLGMGLAFFGLRLRRP
ncbi:hypothetical protein [Streptomyces griseoviridis]|uniref:Translation initiation factor IF-2 n=1 Tax=Streptomyces griseoviridis TaxID=45398 RepID=A0ABT9LGZ8_STRGD|nr:hypothetical protein [Streptomyces griseoviridis]MDP9682997.1 hypothetical protein [Streptomyces griseoviridis]GGS90104.1 hypothetical protein GCM10010240_24370 [Streptomyces griseoviridis]